VYFILKGKYKFVKTISFNSDATLHKLKRDPMLMNFNKNKQLKKHNSKEVTLSVYRKGDVFGYEDIIKNKPRFSKCICRVANSVIWMMNKDDFNFYIYNTKVWKQDIDVSVLTYTNYIKVKMSSL